MRSSDLRRDLIRPRIQLSLSRGSGTNVKPVGRDESLAVEGTIDLLGGSGTGPLWGMASADLNATLLAWPPAHEVAEHVNRELDVLVIVLDGHGTAIIDGETHDLAAGSAILIPRGTRRRITAGETGLRYVSVHRRRGPLQIQTTPER
jgi:mannose-6-phosphate isomerase-like protein (cupin superfamily)